MRSILFITIVLAMQANGQKTTTIYNYLWKPCEPDQARFVSDVIKTDSGWLRNDYYVSTRKLQMKDLYEDSANNMANGYFYYYYANGIAEQTGRNVHNKKEGLWMSFYPDGAMADSAFYEDGIQVGTSIRWHYNGYQGDSVTYGKEGTAVEIGWSSNGNPSQAGRWKNGKMSGPWQFFHNNGTLAATEIYNDTGKLVSATYFNKEGTLQDSMMHRENAAFPGGNKGWQKFVYKNIYFPDQYRITNAQSVTVVVAALIDEDGNVREPYVKVPFNKAFDDIAMAIFKKCPQWLPAMRHNRAIVSSVFQPVTFSQEER